jgi:hypothetical protein
MIFLKMNPILLFDWNVFQFELDHFSGDCLHNGLDFFLSHELSDVLDLVELSIYSLDGDRDDHFLILYSFAEIRNFFDSANSLWPLAYVFCECILAIG